MNDNEQCDELAELLANTRYPNLVPAWTERADRSPVKFLSRKEADAILAAGYRKPRTITTVEERDALREGSVVRDKDGDVIERLWGGWYFGDNNTVPNLPATVIHEPTT